MAPIVVRHRIANNLDTKFFSLANDQLAEGDLVKIKGKLYMFHPGYFWTLFMSGKLIQVFGWLWFYFKNKATPYEALLKANYFSKTQILLELKNVNCDDVLELPTHLAHVDTYDLSLARKIKAKFGCSISIHLLWAGTTGALILRSKKGFFRWHKWCELQDVDIITPTFQLSKALWQGSKYIATLKTSLPKQKIFLGGGFQSRYLRILTTNFQAAAQMADGYYQR